jgi:hypothetical protein
MDIESEMDDVSAEGKKEGKTSFQQQIKINK